MSGNLLQIKIVKNDERYEKTNVDGFTYDFWKLCING